ncbi:MAG: hypothetical protein HZY75_11260 [Nocardioidaceae bacterium]|nr:MAG: hypothetical protein HZY75_11260 [Nocardioidaceae bacterium]
MHARSVTLEEDGIGLPVVRRADGREVGTIPVSWDANRLPQLSDATWIQVDNTGRIAAVHDIESGQLLTTFQTPPAETRLATGSTWNLSAFAVVGNEPSVTVRVRHSDGTTVDSAGLSLAPQSQVLPEFVGVHDGKAILMLYGFVHSVDLASGETKTITGPNPDGSWDGAVLRGNRLIRTTVVTGVEGKTRSYRWVDLDTEEAGQGSVQSSDEATVVFELERAVALSVPPEVGHRKTFTTYDNGTGSTIAEFDNIVEAWPVPDGGAMVTVDDSPDDWLGYLSPDGTTLSRIADLPRVPKSVQGLSLSSQGLSAAFDDGPEATQRYGLAQPGGDGTWQVIPWSTTFQGKSSLSQVLYTNASISTWRLTWPRGTRDFVARSARLARGGKLVVINDNRVERVASPADNPVVVGDVSDSANMSATADGEWVWSVDRQSGWISGIGPEVLRESYYVGPCSRQRSVEAFDRWIMSSCRGVYTLVDRYGVVPNWTVPHVSVGFLNPRLGKNYVLYLSWAGTGADRYPALTVADAATHEVKQFPEALDPVSAAVDSDGWRFAYADWLTGLAVIDRLAPFDTTPPVLRGVTSKKIHEPAKSVKLTFTTKVREESPILSYEMQGQWADVGRPLDGWGSIEPLDRPTVTVRAKQGQQYCFRIRATDKAENRSTWSTPVCSVVGLDDRKISVSLSGKHRVIKSSLASFGRATELRKRGTVARLAPAGWGRGTVGLWIIKRPGAGRVRSSAVATCSAPSTSPRRGSSGCSCASRRRTRACFASSSSTTSRSLSTASPSTGRRDNEAFRHTCVENDSHLKEGLDGAGVAWRRTGA